MSFEVSSTVLGAHVTVSIPGGIDISFTGEIIGFSAGICISYDPNPCNEPSGIIGIHILGSPYGSYGVGYELGTGDARQIHFLGPSLELPGIPGLPGDPYYNP